MDFSTNLVMLMSWTEHLPAPPPPPTPWAPVWLTPQVRSLARGAYEERLLPSGRLDPERLAVLSDALEDAGAIGEVVEHLRGPWPHVRGCFVLDHLLASE